jgi:hypothetical protein
LLNAAAPHFSIFESRKKLFARILRSFLRLLPDSCPSYETPLRKLVYSNRSLPPVLRDRGIAMSGLLLGVVGAGFGHDFFYFVGGAREFGG